LADNSFTHLVVVGSSAGGIGALSGLVSSLPEDFDAPIVVAQHLDPNRESHLQEILARRSPLPVKTVSEHEPLRAGVVFVVPANRHVNITDSEIDLSSEPSSGQPIPSINFLMETAPRARAPSVRPGARSSYRTLRPPSSARCRARWPRAPLTSSLS
jgi:two-component system CheB/CheR fusion protein